MDSRQWLFRVGRPLSPLYSSAMRLRAFFYRHRVLPRARLPVPVISVGNLTLGGSGKTPTVLYLAKFLRERGWKPAVVSRGYRGRAREKVNVVSDGRSLLLDAALAGDEPRFIAETLPWVPVLTGSRREQVGRAAVERFGADIILLDDGFQHLALERDLDLVLFHLRSSLQGGRVFPGGELREPFAALQRAHAVILTGWSPETESLAISFERFLGRLHFDLPLFRSAYRPTGLIPAPGQLRVEAAALQDFVWYGFCALATPASFRATVAQKGLRIGGFQEYRDHHCYTSADLQTLAAAARASGCQGLLTTQKDLVKIDPEKRPEMPLYALRVDLSFGPEFDELVGKYLLKWEQKRGGRV